MPVATLVMTIKNISRHCPMSPGRQNQHQLRSQCFTGNRDQHLDSLIRGSELGKKIEKSFEIFEAYLFQHVSLPFFFFFSESCSVTSDSLWLQGLYSPWNSPGQNTEVGSLSLLQGWNPRLLHCRGILYQLSHKGSPNMCLSFWAWGRTG